MRVIYTFSFLFFLFQSASSQVVDIGLDASYGSSTVTIPNGTFVIGDAISSGEARSGLGRVSAFRTGVYGEYFFNDRAEEGSLQVGLIYSSYGFESEGNKFDLNYIDVDLSFNTYFWGGFSFNVGVTPSLNISSSKDVKVEPFDIRPFVRLGYSILEKYKIYFVATTGVLQVNKEFEMKGNYYGGGVSVPLFSFE